MYVPSRRGRKSSFVRVALVVPPRGLRESVRRIRVNLEKIEETIVSRERDRETTEVRPDMEPREREGCRARAHLHTRITYTEANLPPSALCPLLFSSLVIWSGLECPEQVLELHFRQYRVRSLSRLLKVTVDLRRRG